MPRLPLIALLAVTVCACSLTGTSYRHADWLLEYYAWKTVRTSADQREQWQPVLETVLQRHREQELPLIIAYLDQVEYLQREADGAPGAACLVDGALTLYRRHARLAIELALPLLADLDAGQIEHLAEYTEQRRREAIESHLDPDPQQRRRAREERITERIERWTGTLDESQRALVNNALAHIPDLGGDWIEYRDTHTRELLGLLEAGADTPALRAFLEGWWVRRDGAPAASRQRWRAARTGFIALLDNLATTLSERQRRTFQRRVAGLRADLADFLPDAPQSRKAELAPACAPAPA
jgi:hypothetical protein